MAKNSIRDYANAAASNTDVQGQNIDEGCSPANINNAIREVMADLADVNDGTVALTSPSADSLSTDTISEKTAASGVTVDGVLIKDSKINGSYITDGTIDSDSLASNSVTTAKISDANVTTAKVANDAITSAKIATNAVTNDAYGSSIASQAEAEAGTNNTDIMTPLRTKQAIDNAAQSTVFDAVGTYALLFKITNGNIIAGNTYSGSDLRPASFGRNSWDGNSIQETVVDYVSSTGLSGTWRAMGGSDNFSSVSDIATLFVKISD